MRAAPAGHEGPRKGEAVFAAGVALAMASSIFVTRLRVPAPPAAGTPGPRPFISGTSFCPAPGPEEGVSAQMSADNLSASPITIRRLAFSPGRPPSSEEEDLGSRRRLSAAVPPGSFPGAQGFGSPAPARSILLLKGAGGATSACADQPLDSWFLAWATTARGQKASLLVMKPFGEEAVVRVRILGPDGDSAPARLKDVVVAPQSERSIALADYVVETPSFGVELRATRGRVVAARFVRTATRNAVTGLDLDLGVSHTATRWFFAGGLVPPDGAEDLFIVNPSDREALAQITFQTESEQVAPAQLQDLAIPAGRLVHVKVDDYLPRGTRHGTSVVCANGVGIVAERQTLDTVEKQKSVSGVFGIPNPGRHWLVSAGSPAGGSETLAVVNEGRDKAVVSASILSGGDEASPDALRAVEVEPGRRATLDLSPYLPPGGGDAVVEATSDVAVESELRLGAPYKGFDQSPGMAVDSGGVLGQN